MRGVVVVCLALLGLDALATPPIKPYVRPDLDPEPAVETGPHSALLVVDPGVQVVARPWYGAPLVGALSQDATVPLTGVVASRSRRGCFGKPWYRLAPSAYVCSSGVAVTDQPVRADPGSRIPGSTALPFAYVMVALEEPATLPLFATPVDARAKATPERLLTKGDTVAVQKKISLDGVPHYLTVDGRAIPVEGTWWMKERSAWVGLVLAEGSTLPLGWTTPLHTRVFHDPERRQAVVSLPRRSRVEILGQTGEGARRMLRIGESRWIRASDVNEVLLEAPPADAEGGRWIDVNLGEQTLTAYQGARPVYATLVSSGKAVATPRGDYPIWAKASAVTMANQAYEDAPYFVHMVPWALFFQAHNAIHGAYWHDRFGIRRSHGCVNVSPRDARWLFEWAPPSLPPGWMGIRPVDLGDSVRVHVRDSNRRRPFVQERAWGPPDPEEERLRLEEAEQRRAQEGVSGSAELPPAPVPVEPVEPVK